MERLLRISRVQALAIVLAAVAPMAVRPGITALAQRSQNGSLQGRVIDERSGKPIKGAAVTLTRYDTDKEHAQKKTAADGSFSFTAVPAGGYIASVTMDHYIEQEYGEREPGGWGKVIALRSGESKTAIDFRMARKGTIRGTVVDQTGAPLPNVTVVVFERYVDDDRNGYWDLAEVGVMTRHSDLEYIEPFKAKTDASGHYRLEDLEPGDYFVTALPRTIAAASGGRSTLAEAYAPVLGGNKSCLENGAAGRNAALLGLQELDGRSGNVAAPTGLPREIDLPIFYPDAIHPLAATEVHMGANTDLQGIDLTIRPLRAAALTGKVTVPGVPGAPEPPAFCANVALLQRGPGAYLRGPQFGPTVLTLNGSNTFRFDAIIPGLYTIVAVSGPPDHAFMAIKDIEALPGASLDVTLALQQVFDVPGRIVLNGPAPAGFDLAAVSVRPNIQTFVELPLLLQNLGYFALTNTRSRVEADGTFVARYVLPGQRYTFGLSGKDVFRVLPSMMSLRYGESEFSDWGTFTATDRGVPVTIRLDFRFQRVEGVVMEGDKPKAGALAVLARRGGTRRRDTLYTDSDAQGRVVFDKVAPGDYDVYALEDRSQRSSGAPSAAQGKAQGQMLHVEDAAVPDLKIQVIRPHQ